MTALEQPRDQQIQIEDYLYPLNYDGQVPRLAPEEVQAFARLAAEQGFEGGMGILWFDPAQLSVGSLVRELAVGPGNPGDSQRFAGPYIMADHDTGVYRQHPGVMIYQRQIEDEE